MVERGPEKAGVGGSIPSLATIPFNNLASLKNPVKISRAHNTRPSVLQISLLALLVGATFTAHLCVVETTYAEIIRKEKLLDHNHCRRLKGFFLHLKKIVP